MPFVKGKPKTGGRVKGKSGRIVKVLEQIKATGKKDPVEFMIEVMNDESQPLNIRLDASKAVAPYVNRKMPTEIESKNEHVFPDAIKINFIKP